MQWRQLRFILIDLMVATFVCLVSVGMSVGEEPRTERYLYPAKDVDPAMLKSDNRVVVTEAAEFWSFAPRKGASPTALLFFPGGGVDPTAYAPLVRTVAAEGLSVHLVKLSGEFAAPDKHRRNAIARGQEVIKATPGVKCWVVGGHSMGGAIAAQFVHEEPKLFRGLILIGTTHPRDFDLSSFIGDVTKVYGTEDGVAKHAQIEANQKLLPAGTTWVRLEGGNHAQFGFYGPQFGDGKATISREKQQQVTCDALVKALRAVSELPE
jgi:pimeloyl-ACP methyl ester carboxylesterase